MMKYDFTATVNLIMRGPDDPLHYFKKNKWRRGVWREEIPVLLEIAYDKKPIIKAINTEVDIKDLNALKKILLGTDDPLLIEKNRGQFPLSKSKKIEPFFAQAVPGYTCLYEAMILTLLGQQVSVAVANRMRNEFLKAFGLSKTIRKQTYFWFPTPAMILKSPAKLFDDLKLSGMKKRAIQEAAEFMNQFENPLKYYSDLSSTAVRESLTQLHGVGDWTCDWLMLRALRRFDILPASDLAVRKAWAWWTNSKEILSSEEVIRRASRWKSIAGVLTQRILSAYQMSKIC